MGIAELDRTLPTNQMIFDVRRDMDLYARFRNDLDGLMDEYKLSRVEKEALREVDIQKLSELGVHPYFLPQISRLFHGSAYNHNDSEAARAYAKSLHLKERGLR